MENLEQIMPSPARETTLQKVLETLERIEEVICFGFHNNQSETSQDDQADFADEREQVQAFSDQRGKNYQNYAYSHQWKKEACFEYRQDQKK